MAERRRQAKNQSMFIRPPPSQPRQTWLWLAPYVAIGVFALAMLIVTGLLQWREQDTALSALEGDMHWAERTIEARLHAHQDFLTELGREQEFRQLTYESFQVRASRYVRDNPEISAIIWVNTEGKVEWVAPNESTVTFVVRVTELTDVTGEVGVRLRIERGSRTGCCAESGTVGGAGLKEVVRIGTGDCLGRDTRRKGLPITLEKILDLRHILLVPVFRSGEISSPFRRSPDFQTVIHSDEEEFLIFIHWNELTEAAWDQDAAGFIDI